MERYPKIISQAQLILIANEAVMEAELESGLTICYIDSNGTPSPPSMEDYDTFCDTVMRKIEEAGFIYNMN